MYANKSTPSFVSKHVHLGILEGKTLKVIAGSVLHTLDYFVMTTRLLFRHSFVIDWGNYNLQVPGRSQKFYKCVASVVLVTLVCKDWK